MKILQSVSSLTIFFVAMSNSSLEAHPSERRLPHRLITEGVPFAILRDSARESTFYVLPLTGKIEDQSLGLLPGQDSNCSIAKDYDTIQKEYTEATSVLGREVIAEREYLSDLQTSLTHNQKQQMELKSEIFDLEIKLSDSDVANSKALDFKLQAKKKILADLSKEELEIRKKVSESSKESQNLNLPDQSSPGLKKLTFLKQSLLDLTEKLVAPVAEVSMRVHIIQASDWDSNWREKLGFIESDRVIEAPIIGLDLYPKSDALTSSLLEQVNRREQVGATEPRWSEKAFEVKVGALTENEVNASVNSRPEMPADISLNQTLSLYTYCTQVAPRVITEAPLLNLGVNYSIAEWLDSSKTNRSFEEVAFDKVSIVDENVWKAISELKTIERLDPQLDEDYGSPKFFRGGEGQFWAKTFHIQFAPKKEKQTETKNEIKKGQKP